MSDLTYAQRCRKRRERLLEDAAALFREVCNNCTDRRDCDNGCGVKAWMEEYGKGREKYDGKN